MPYNCTSIAHHSSWYILIAYYPYILYTTGGVLNLPAVVAGAVVAFLLLMLLIAGIIVGAVLLRKLKKKTRTINNGEWVDGIEHTEKSTEFTGRG